MKKNKTILIIAAAAAAYFLYREWQKKAAVRAADAAIKALEKIKLPK